MNITTYVWVLVSISGCAYQVIILTADYLKYEVVSSVSIAFPIVFELPSVTWCIPTFQILNWTLVRKREDCDRIFRVSIFPNETCRNFSEWHFAKNLPLRDNHRVSNNILNHYHADQLFNLTLAAEDLISYMYLNNLAVSDVYLPHEMNDVWHVEEYFVATSKCFRMRLKHDHRWTSTTNLTVGTATRNLFAGFRFHDRLKHYSDQLSLSFGGNEDHCLSYSNDVSISISTFVMAFVTHDVYVSRLLPRPYQTDCFDYKKHAGFDSQKHCFETCLANKTKNAFGKKVYSLNVGKGDAEMTTNYSFRGGRGLFRAPEGELMRKILANVTQSCESKCRQVDCYRKTFATRMISSRGGFGPAKETYHYYYASNTPEMSISTSAKFPLIEYLVVTASCFGFWFGFSVLSMASSLLDLLFKIKGRIIL